ncbi:MAG: hypothetical protein AAF696_37235, partial [Bacteroidota bacterium]
LFCVFNLLDFTSAYAQKSQELTFRANTVVETALLTIKPGKEKQFSEDYFSEAIKFAPIYGARPIGSFALLDRKMGNAPAQMLVFFEWESLEKKRAFEKDLAFLKIVNIRNDALSFLTTGYFQVEQDVSFTFAEGKTYEFAALWLDPDHAPKLQAYFEKVGPIAADPKVGFQPIAQLQSLGVEDRTYHPNLIFLSEWTQGTLGRDYALNRRDYKKALPLRTSAAPYIDMFLIAPIIQ